MEIATEKPSTSKSIETKNGGSDSRRIQTIPISRFKEIKKAEISSSVEAEEEFIRVPQKGRK